MVPRDDIEAIRLLIAQETRFLRHYNARVTSTDDPKQAGRVRATVPMLGWNTDSQTTWFWPRDKHSMLVPAVGEWIEVYFVHGDPNLPVYLGNAAEIQGQTPQAFDGKQTTMVLFQDPATGFSIVWDGSKAILNMLGSSIVIQTSPQEIDFLGNGDNLVLFSALATAISNLAGVFNAHSHGAGTYSVAAAPGPVAGTSGSPGSTMSGDISAAKAAHLKTNG